MKKILLFILFSFFIEAVVAQAVYQSVGSGNWTTSSTWTCTSNCPTTPTYPQAGDDAIISGGHFVELYNPITVANVTVQGTTARPPTDAYLDVYSNLSVTGTLTISNSRSTLWLNEQVTLSAGTIINNGGVFDPSTYSTLSGTTVSYTGTSNLSNTTGGYVNLQINSGASVTLAGNTEIAGNFINNGTLSAGTNTVTFSGSTLTSGSSTTTFYNINVTGSLTIGSQVRLSNYMTFGSGSTVDFGGSASETKFTVLSTKENDITSGLGDYSSSTLLNKYITVQRYIAFHSDAADNWRYLASPLEGVTVQDWDNEIQISNNYIGGEFDNCTSCTPSLFYYNESDQGNLSEGWVAFPSETQDGLEVFEHGRGYSIYIFDKDETKAFNMSGQLPSDGNLPVSFTLNNVGEPSAGVDGWNLVGNPYVSNIDVFSGGFNFGVGMYQTVYVKDNLGKNNARGAFLTATPAGDYTGNWGGYPGIIAKHQGFWVQAEQSSGASLSISQSAKTASAAVLFRTKEEITNAFRVYLHKDKITDELLIRYRRGATPGIDLQYDAPKRLNPTINIASLIGEKEFAINVLPVTNRENINLSLNSENPKGEYFLTFKGFETFETDFNVHLYDAYLDETIKVTEKDSISFSINDDPASFGSDRFKLMFNNIIMSNKSNPRGLEKRDIRLFPNPVKEVAYIDVNNEEPTELEIISIEGKTIKSQKLNQGQNNISTKDLPNGIYIFSIRGESFSYSQRIIKN